MCAKMIDDDKQLMPTLPIAKRIPIIARGIWAGKKIGEKDQPGTIAYECGVTAATIRRDKHSVSFREMYETFATEFLQELREVLKIRDEKGNARYLALAISEKGRLIRAMLPRKVEGTIVQHVVVEPVFSPLLQSKPVETKFEVIEEE